ncbi:MAG: YedE family putative selenium transporter [Oscillospiraceae bacterium]|nr:YedE family putative selenium transporter [Oscillospiraceae bacterium]MCL2278364.1 YedE family putative selenium transporter [Oscillospiraceae bacterium]
MAEKLKLPLVGALTAVISIALVLLGNPGNMGFCIACFLRDTAGALGLHGAAAVQYARPEAIGIVIGALVMSLIRKEFSAKGGSAPATRFVLGACVMIGALVFLGCPLRMVLRMAGGDLNALVGLFGFVGGILLGMFFLQKGYTLKRTYDVAKTDGLALPVMSLLLLAALIFVPSILLFSESGPGAAHAPMIIALVAGLIMGAVGFVSRLCFVGGIRDSFMFKSFSMLSGFIALLVVGIIGNIIFGQFNLGFENQPVAHTEWVWNILGLGLVGFGSVLLGGCPFRQMVMAGSGNSDSTIAVFGMIFGAAIAHNFSLASSPAGTTANGRVAFVVAFVIVAVIAVFNTFYKKKARANA